MCDFVSICEINVADHFIQTGNDTREALKDSVKLLHFQTLARKQKLNTICCLTFPAVS